VDPLSARGLGPRRPAARRGRCAGMTMSEVLIAAVLLSFVVMGSITALSQSYSHIRHARMVTLAGQVLQSVMEDLRLNN
jgi:Tfp pilus assembly protein PilV